MAEAQYLFFFFLRLISSHLVIHSCKGGLENIVFFPGGHVFSGNLGVLRKKEENSQRL